MEPANETCDTCRFDASVWTDEDTWRTLETLHGRWSLATAGLTAEEWATRPNAQTWSAVEYLAHSADVVELVTGLVAAIVVAPGLEVPAPDDTPLLQPGVPQPEIDVSSQLDRLAIVSATLAAQFRELDRAARSLRGKLGDVSIDVRSTVRHVVHDASHHLLDVGRVRAAIGAGSPWQRGVVEGLFLGTGGVPKLPAARLDVGYRGPVGDSQRNRRHHGRVWQALCLWSSGVLEELAAAGHPIAPGAAGENITVSKDIDWSTLRPGTRVAIGEMLCEISAPAVPCKQNARWFHDHDFRRIHHERAAGVSRLYASVLRDGEVAMGDTVEVEP